MNIYEIIKLELDEHKDWNLIQMLYYIYIRSCQIFIHDSRWMYNRTSSNEGIIFDKEINIFNCSDRRVVCSSFSRAFCDLCNCLLCNVEEYDTALTEGYSNHMYARVYTKDKVINFDPLAVSNDFLRAKRHLPIRGIRLLSSKDDFESLMENELDNEIIFNKIGYKIDNLNYLKFLKEKLSNPDLTKRELFSILVKNIDYEGLSLIELNNFINMHLRRLFGKNFDSLGVTYESKSNYDLIDLYFSCDGEEICHELENSSGSLIKF